MWKVMGSGARARKNLGSAVKSALSDPAAKYIYNPETGEVYTKDGRQAIVVSVDQVRALARAVGTVLVAVATRTPFPTNTFMKLLALAGEPFVGLSVEESQKISQALRENLESSEKTDGEGGPGVGADPA